MNLQPGDLCMLVRLGNGQQRFNGEFVRLVRFEGRPFNVSGSETNYWRVEPLFPLPESIEPLCPAQYLRRIDPEGRQTVDWNWRDLTQQEHA